MIYRLIILNGPCTGQRITVETRPMSIGRAADADVVLHDPEVADHHASMEHTANGLSIRDLGSMAGILINGRECRVAALKHGDEIEVGRTRLLVQAIVPADVDHPAEASFSRAAKRRRFQAVAVVLALVGAAGFTVWYQLGALPLTSGTAGQSTNRVASSGRGGLSGAGPGPNSGASAKPVAATPTSGDKSASPAVATPADLQTNSVRLAMEPMSIELRQVRDDLTNLKHMVQNISPTPAAPIPTPLPTPGPDPVAMKAEELFRQALAHVKTGNDVEAERLLDTIQLMTPRFEPAYEQRAKLYERRSQVGRAILEWKQLLSVGASGEFVTVASNEIVRLSKVMTAAAGAIRILDATHNRFESDERVDELRSVHVVVRADAGMAGFKADLLRMEVEFFDMTPSSGEVRPSRARVALSPQQFDPATKAGEEITVTATYMIPKGGRQRVAGGTPERYYGYRVRLYYDGRVVDSLARPVALLQFGQAGGSKAGGSVNR